MYIVQFPFWLFRPPFATIAMQSISGFQRHSPLNTIKSTYLIFNSFGAPKLLFSMVVHIIVTFHCWSIIPIDKTVNFWCAHGKSHGHGQNIKSVPVTVAMGNAYYVFFFVPMVIAMGMPMPTVMGMPMTMCTGTYTIGKHAVGWWFLNVVFQKLWRGFFEWTVKKCKKRLS